jgi:DNA sulfur modification protein DndC
LLRDLLQVQRKVKEVGVDGEYVLIRQQELEHIRVLWRLEEHDWADSVPQIYREVLGTSQEWIRYETPLFSADDQATLSAICYRNNLPMELVAKLIELERSLQGMNRRASIQRKLAAVIEEDWRAKENLLSSPANGV